MQKSNKSGTTWFDCLLPRPEARFRLFCFPYAGGGASIYRTVAEQISPEIEVYPVQLPGREKRFRERPFTRLEDLILALAEVLIPYLDKPSVLWGHSMGALIAFELARFLRRARQDSELQRLVVSGHRAPHLPDQRPAIHNVPEEELLQVLRRFDGTPQEVLQHQELLAMVVPLLRADFAICETYVYTSEPPLACPISAFGGLQDPYVPAEAISAWNGHTIGEFQARFFTGGHFFLRQYQAEILAAITRDLIKEASTPVTLDREDQDSLS
ncbi:MAG TPA: alpha/beta fold hydrolase [Ktedonobacteraceae bacterium]